jgi:tetratricopeptide (TPR) repeat protein
MNDLLNPYIAGAPVVEMDMFFGREDVFGWIERNLRGKYVDHILVIHGQRRVGKTSVLKQIPNFVSDRYVQVFFDLQGRTNTSLERFLWWLTREISRTLKRRHNLLVPPPDRVAFMEDPETLFTHFLPEVGTALGELTLLLTFDEFDTLNQTSIQESLTRPLIQTLRRMMELESLSFIFSIGSSGQKLENMRAAYTDFFKTALYKKISFLDQEDCRELITKPVEGVLGYNSEAVQHIYSMTAGHPYFTQLVCHELFSVCQKTGVRDITRGDVDAILGDVIERGTVNLKFVWDDAGDLEKWALACLARSPECRDPEKLILTLREQRVRFSEADLLAALVLLQEKDVLTVENHFIVELLRLWLRQNRPLERVREELVEASPIADRYIEIGETYWEQGQRENALESFRQALEVDPGNVKARVSIGILLFEARELGAAATAFEQALALDADDVAALSGYCQAQLALGDQAREKNVAKEALDHYQAVLAINPKHIAARERLAGIYMEKAEEDLDAGQDDAALLAFQTALDYSPENDDLVSRVEQVMAEKKTKTVQTLSNRADSAQANGDWQAAIAALQDALILTGEDVTLEKKLAEVKVSQRAHLLNMLPDQARKFETTDDWESAIQIWEEYLALYPQDQEAAESALGNAHKMQVVKTRYANAREALEEKNYPLAIKLLQQVIQADPGYKDASQLMATAVRSGRRKQVRLFRWSWYALPILFILISIGAYFGLRSTNQFPVIAFQRTNKTATSSTTAPLVQGAPTVTIFEATNTVVSTPEAALSPGIMISPTQSADSVESSAQPILNEIAKPTLITPTAQPPAWIKDFVEPIYKEISDKSPDFEDDFSDVNPNWVLSRRPEGEIARQVHLVDYVENGVLRLDIEQDINYALEPRYIDSLLDNPNYVLEFDIQPVTSNINFLFDRNGQTQFYFDLAHGWTIHTGANLEYRWMPPNREILNQSDIHVQILARGGQFAVYLNGEPASYTRETLDSNIYFGNMINFFSNSVQTKVALDNLRIWKLEPSD